MPPKAGRGRGKKQAGRCKSKKRKAEETEIFDVQEDTTQSPTREMIGRKSRKDISQCGCKTLERSSDGSRSPQQSQESPQHSPSPPPAPNSQTESSDDGGKFYNLILVVVVLVGVGVD